MIEARQKTHSSYPAFILVFFSLFILASFVSCTKSGALTGGSGSSGGAVINEVTTAAFMGQQFAYGIVKDSNGTVTFSGNQVGLTNAAAQFNNFITNGQVNSSLSTTSQDGFLAIANAIASCVQNQSKCGTLFANAQTSSGTASVNLLEAVYNIMNVSLNQTPVYTLAVTMANQTGFQIPSSSPSGFVFNPPPVLQSSAFTGGNGPNQIAIDTSGNLWVTDNNVTTVSELSPSGATLGTFTVGTDPDGIAIDAAGNVWVANFASNNVTELNSSGATLGTFSVSTPQSLAIDASGNVWVSTRAGNSIVELSSSGATLKTISPSGANLVVGSAIDASGNLWAANASANNILYINASNGALLRTVAVGTFPRSISIDPSGNIWTSNATSNNLTKLNPSGTTLGTFSIGSNPAKNTIDAAGNVWVAFQNSNTVTELNSQGTLLGSFNVGSTPFGAAIDSAGNVFTANFGAATVTRLAGAAAGSAFSPFSGPIYSNGCNCP